MIITGLIVGAVLGIVMQRGRFCVTGMLRDIFLQRSWRTFVALLIVISVHAVGIAALTSLGVISPEFKNFSPVAVVVGGFIFGLGIILAGGCASGTWYRSGEGLVGSWMALVFYAASAAAMKTGFLTGFASWLTSYKTNLTTIPEATGLSPWYFAIALSLGTIVAARYFLAKERRIATLPVAWYRRPLHVYLAGALVGIIGVIAWPLSAATGRNDGLGITTPSANLANYTVTGDPERLDWGVMLVLGILVGSLIAAKLTGEFRIRVPEGKTMVRSVIGGAGMGIGAALAGGCTVGNGMVQTSLFSFQGWVALLFIALGVGVGTKLWLKPSKAGAAKKTTEHTYTTAESIDDSFHTSAEDAVIATNIAAETDSETDSPLRKYAVASSVITLTKPKTTKARQLAPGKFALDTLGAVCPFPLIEAKDVMKELDSGDELVIDFDCTQATEAIPRWAATDGHEVTNFEAKGDAGWQITVRKG